MRGVAVCGLFCLLSVLLASPALAAPVTVDGVWLEQHLRDPDLVVVDMTDDELQYNRYHIPGAVRLAYGDLVKSRRDGRAQSMLSDAELTALLGHLGIQRSARVVIYDDVGGLNAGRLFLELERLAHPAVSVLDGGLVRWVLDGRRVDNIPVVRQTVVYQSGPERRANIAGLAEVRQASANAGSAVLLDVRSRDEYLGSDREARSGHVPRARWWPWEHSVRMESGFLFQEPETLLASLEKVGAGDTNTPVILYCRSGHRASQSYLMLRRLGFENVRVHAGSMLEYLLDRRAPLVRGAAP
jgi:thiosulfate/3-mercaptopyruvate sulfurtransferase